MDNSGGQQPTPQTLGAGLPQASPQEEEILSRLRQGGEAALASQFMRQRARLRRMIEVRLDHRLSGRVDPSDMLQEVFLEAVRRLDDYLAHPSMPLFLWLRYLTGQRILAIHRQYLGEQKQVGGHEGPGTPAVRPEADSACLSRHLLDQFCSAAGRRAILPEVSGQLERIIAQLDPMDREILALRHFEQLTNQEVAEELGIRPGVASQRYIRALERLREVLKTWHGLQT